MVNGIITQIIPVGKGDEIRGFTIHLETPIVSKPGQYVMIAHPAFPGEKRSFSVVESNENEITLYIKKIGDVTNAMHVSRVGQPLTVTGPYGRFVLPEEDKPLVFIAGGIGITPLYRMTKSILPSPRKETIYLFYSNRTPAETALRNEIRAIQDPRIKIFWSFTREQVEGASMERISATLIQKNVPEFSTCEFYICGPKPMMDELIGQLHTNGVPDERIHIEDFNPTTE